jgi:iron complex transport system ATP-binding protein
VSALFEIEALKIAHGPKVVLEIEHLVIPARPAIAIIGPNGAGKSTLLRNLLRDTQHARRAGGATIRGQLHAGEMAFVAQHEFFATPLTVTEYVLLGCHHHLRWYARPSPQDQANARELLRQFDLEALADKRVAVLSGGEQQRAAIVRALMQETRIVLLDEPNNHLDIRHQHLLMRQLRHHQHVRGLNCLMVLHDLGLAANYCDYVILMAHGRIEAAGAPDEIMVEERLSRAYEWSIRPYRLRSGVRCFDTFAETG